MPQKVQKFRPYLTQSQVLKILELVSKEDARDPDIKGIKAALSMFQFKMENDLISPSYTTTPKPSIEEKLGFSNGTINVYDAVEVRKKAFEKYCFNPAECTEKEIALAFTYKYETGLMSEEERNEYETKMLG